MKIWKFEYLKIWILENLNIWKFGYENIWIWEYLNIWKFEYENKEVNQFVKKETDTEVYKFKINRQINRTKCIWKKENTLSNE